MVAGDWHGNTLWAVSQIRIAAPLLPPGRRIILHLGDFGIWPGLEAQVYLNEVTRALTEAGAELWFIDGNHEDHDRLHWLRVNGPRHPDGRQWVTRRIWWLPRGHRWEWHGRTWLAAGGATSPDRATRKHGVDWWPEEALSAADIAAITGPGHADVMACHDCPAGVRHTFGERPGWWTLRDMAALDRHRELLQDLVSQIKPAALMHGHLHIAYQRTCDFGYGPVEVTGLGPDGTQGNWAILDTTSMEWDKPAMLDGHERRHRRSHHANTPPGNADPEGFPPA